VTATPIDDDLHVRFERVSMAYGQRPVFDDLSCGFPRGKISVILGGSGSGKSTILRLIGGLIRPRKGDIYVAGENIVGYAERQMQTVRAKLGMMFQGGALLDSYTVAENLALPLREHSRLTGTQVQREVHQRLEAVGLTDVEGLLPNELSGGMVRRVALARAVIRNPAILMCDEPFSGLDPASVKRIEALMLERNRAQGTTILMVSHHIPSTMRMADHVLLLLRKDKAVEGAPAQLRRSADPEVVDFLNEDVSSALAPPASPPSWGVSPPSPSGSPGRCSPRRCAGAASSRSCTSRACSR
jgi:phospholipid/cholesterol/gamma-HCH transport system ATP-binding protein